MIYVTCSSKFLAGVPCGFDSSAVRRSNERDFRSERVLRSWFGDPVIDRDFCTPALVTSIRQVGGQAETVEAGEIHGGGAGRVSKLCPRARMKSKTSINSQEPC